LPTSLARTTGQSPIQYIAERRLAVLAKHRLEQLLGSGSVDIRRNAHPDPPDRYGRALARVLVDGEDVACVLIKEGYARQWTGRREDWCTSLDERKPAEATLSCAVTY